MLLFLRMERRALLGFKRSRILTWAVLCYGKQDLNQSQKKVVVASKCVVVEIHLYDGCYADGLSPYSGWPCYLLSIEHLVKEQVNVPYGSLQRFESLSFGCIQNVDV